MIHVIQSKSFCGCLLRSFLINLDPNCTSQARVRSETHFAQTNNALMNPPRLVPNLPMLEVLRTHAGSFQTENRIEKPNAASKPFVSGRSTREPSYCVDCHHLTSRSALLTTYIFATSVSSRLSGTLTTAASRTVGCVIEMPDSARN